MKLSSGKKRVAYLGCLGVAVLCAVIVVILVATWYENTRVHDGPVPDLHAVVITYRSVIRHEMSQLRAYDCSTGRTTELPGNDQNDLARRLSLRDRWQLHRWRQGTLKEDWKVVGSPVWKQGRLTLDRYKNGRPDGTVTLTGRADAPGRLEIFRTDVAPYGYSAAVLSQRSWHVCLFNEHGRVMKELGPGVSPVFSARDHVLSYMEVVAGSGLNSSDVKTTGNVVTYNINTRERRSIYLGSDAGGYAWDRRYLICEKGPEEALYIIDTSRRIPRWYSTPLTGGRQIVWFMVGRMPKP